MLSAVPSRLRVRIRLTVFDSSPCPSPIGKGYKEGIDRAAGIGPHHMALQRHRSDTH